MKNKKEIRELKETKRGKRISIIIIILTLIIGVIAFIYAQQNESLEQELARIEQDLSDSGYGWLVDYSELNKNNLSANQQTSVRGLGRI